MSAELGSRRVIWLHELATGAVSPITFDGFSEFPEWSADGTRIVYVQRGASVNDAGLQWQSSDGSHPPERLFANGRQLYAGSLARDGRTLVRRRSASG